MEETSTQVSDQENTKGMHMPVPSGDLKWASNIQYFFLSNLYKVSYFVKHGWRLWFHQELQAIFKEKL